MRARAGRLRRLDKILPAALTAYTAHPSQTSTALIYLDAFLVANELIDTGMSQTENEEISICHGSGLFLQHAT